jgi:hypothetical protein
VAARSADRRAKHVLIKWKNFSESHCTLVSGKDYRNGTFL